MKLSLTLPNRSYGGAKSVTAASLNQVRESQTVGALLWFGTYATLFLISLFVEASPTATLASGWFYLGGTAALFLGRWLYELAIPGDVAQYMERLSHGDAYDLKLQETIEHYRSSR